MLVNFARFNYRSTDLEAEERNYSGHHVELAKRLPGLRFYYTGRLMKMQGMEPDHLRAAILGWDSAADIASALTNEVGKALTQDTREHLKGLVSRSLEAEVIVPFDSRKPGDKCFAMAAEFDLASKEEGVADSEAHYRGTHVEIARRLPGLRNYVIGKLAADGTAQPDRYRMAILVFDSVDDLRSAYRSPVGRDLVVDEDFLIRRARVFRIDARVEV